MRVLLFASLLSLSVSCPAQESVPVSAPIVFFDIAGPASTGLKDFYAELFGWTAAADGNMRVTVSPPLFGTFRVEAVPETLIYIGVTDVSAKLEEIVARGGTVDFARLVVPGVVILGMFRDPAGNRVGLVEIDSTGKAVVPPVPGR